MSLIGVGTAIVGLVADAGISSLIGNVAATVTTKSGNKIFDKLMIGVGTAVVGCMAGEAAQKYIDRKGQELEEALSHVSPKEEEVTEDDGEVSE